jgi:ferredoxin
LLSAAERLAAIDRSAITLEAGRCLHTLDRCADCEACFEICPAQAIQAGEPQTLDSGRCQSCLACLTVCPTGAYAAEDAAGQLFHTAAQLETHTLELVCARNPQAELGIDEESTAIRVRGCLAGLGSGTYTALAAFALEHICVRTDACALCEWAALFPEVEAQVARAKYFLQPWGKEETLMTLSRLEAAVERPLWNADNPPLSRRDLFRMFARQGQIAMARAYEKGQMPHGRQPGRDRSRLLNAAAHLPAAEMGAGLDLGPLGFAWVTAAESCSACGACARACPTGALSFEKNEEGTAYALKFSARRCMGCEMCVHFCAVSALTVDHAPQFRRVLGEESAVLVEGALVACKRCGTCMAEKPDTQVCPLCEQRRKNPFGSILPPGLQREKRG